MAAKRYLAITGGVGGAKLSLGLSKLLGADEIAFIVNTGDDFEHLGLHISPDIDTLVYTLSGENNTATGWGRRDESWQFMAALETLGGKTWFSLGDKDLAMHVERSRRLATGESLSEVTATLAGALGVKHRILPMSNDPVRTVIHTQQGSMDFQRYFVRERCEPAVNGFEFAGSESAGLNPEVLEWMEHKEFSGVILCPSNPFVSIDPILSVPGFREQLRACSTLVIAVSPVVGGAAIKGPTVKMMQELSIPNTATQVARHYRDFLDGFVLDVQDESLKAEVKELGMAIAVTNTVMKTLDDRVGLAATCLGFIEELS